MPGELTLSQAQGIYTEALAAVFKDRPKVMGFLRSWFPSRTFPTLLVNLLIQRSSEFIAMDIYRGESGNRNSWSRTSQKIFETYYFREKFDVTRLQLYEKMYSGIGINADVFAAFINDVVEHQIELRETIERTIELMCSQVFENGVIVGPGTGIVIDYKRKAESMVDLGSGNYWTDSNVDPKTIFEQGGQFMREKGKVQGGTFKCIMGGNAKPALFANTKFRSDQNLFNQKLDDTIGPQKDAAGGTYHGLLSSDNYKFELWTYTEGYERRETDGSKTFIPYINENKIIILPSNASFFTAFGAVPQVVNSATGGRMIVPKMGEFIFTDNVDEENRTHYYNVESAPLPMLDAVDRVFTAQVVED